MHRAQWVLGLALFGTAAVTACGSSSSSSSSAGSDTGAASASTSGSTSSAAAPSSSSSSSSAASSKEVTLTVLEHQQLRIDAMEKTIVPQFEAAEKAAGKNVHVKLVKEVLPDDQFASKLTLQYSQGKGPDVTSFVASSVPDYASAGYLLDLTSRIQAWPDWKAHFYPVVQNLSTMADGHIYAMPRGATVLELFYRKDVLQKLGVSTAQPTSWTDLITRLKQVQQKTGKPAVVYPAGTQWGGGTFDEGFIHVFLGTGGTLYDANAKKWVVKSDGLTKAFGFYDQLQQAKLLPDGELLSPQPWQPTKYVDFVKGVLPVTTSGSWAWQYDWGKGGGAPIPNLTQVVSTWAFPTDDGSPPFVTANLDWAWAISKTTKNPDIAWDWVTFSNTGQGLAEDINAAGALAPRDDVKDVAPYSQNAPLVRAETQLAGAKVFKPAAGIAKIQEAVGKATESILTGKANGQQAADQFAKDATKLLGANAVSG